MIVGYYFISPQARYLVKPLPPSFHHISSLQATPVGVGGVRIGVVTEAQRALGLVYDTIARRPVHVVVLGAAELVHRGLGVGLRGLLSAYTLMRKADTSREAIQSVVSLLGWGLAKQHSE
jgi:hypothetical protein